MKKIGIGYENYKEFIDENCYYVDKTMLIEDVIRKGGKVTLFTRPRRFGKKLGLSMIRTFFECGWDLDGKKINAAHYFEGKKIMQADPDILSMMGQYPVINLSLKSANQPDFRTAFLKLKEMIDLELLRHAYLKESDQLNEDQRKMVVSMLEFKPENEIITDEDLKREVSKYSTILKTLSMCLALHHRRKVIVLLDEYDVPLESAYYNGFYQEMVVFIRSMFESVLKTNESLEFAVVTGCLQISKKSIFTGLNHLEINSVRQSGFEEAFGFTQEETEEMLKTYGLEDKLPEAKKWYDGYLFGTKEIYNPWSITKYVKGKVIDHMQFPEPYWANTSSNTIIKDLIDRADTENKEELDALINGGTIEKKIHEDITYDDIHESSDNLWNFLFFTGYLKKVSERQDGRDIYLTMKIPNEEIGSIYENKIRDWFDKRVRESDHTGFYQAVLEGNADKFTEYVNRLLFSSISTFDCSESFYHGFLLSLLSNVPGYRSRSNREAGEGRPDIILYPVNAANPAIIFELKVRKKFNEMADGLKEAIKQIKDMKYEEGILEEGYVGVKAYGVCFCRKNCVMAASC